jgi:hypothetical protein
MKKKMGVARLLAFLTALLITSCDAYFFKETEWPEPEPIPQPERQTLKKVSAVSGGGAEYTLTLELDGEVDLVKEDIGLTAGGDNAAACLISKDSLTPAGEGKYDLKIGTLIYAAVDVEGVITVTLPARKGDVLLSVSDEIQPIPVIFHGVSPADVVNLIDVSAPVPVPGSDPGEYNLTLTFDAAVPGVESRHISLTMPPQYSNCLLSKESFGVPSGSNDGTTWLLRINALVALNNPESAPVTVHAGGKVDGRWLLGSGTQEVEFRPTGVPVSLYQGSLDITYVDGTGGRTMSWKPQGGFMLDGAPTNKMIYKVAVHDFPAKTYLVGRRDSEALNLNLDGTGELRFRLAVGGYIPVGTIAELKMINTNENTLGDSYLLDVELDLLGDSSYSGVSAADQQWTPIGNAQYVDNAAAGLWPLHGPDSGLPFTGIFNGAGKQIHNLRITGSGTNIGLFGVVNNSGPAEARIINVKVRGSVSGADNAGGIVGQAREKVIIDNCESGVTVTVTGNNAGGIAGLAGEYQSMEHTLISNCTTRSSVTVTAQNNAGGIVGTGRDITNCHNAAAVNAAGDNAGGIAGTGSYLRENSSTGEGRAYLFIENCGNSGAVSAGGNNAGGIAGKLGFVTVSWQVVNSWLRIYGCANSSNVTAANHAGGILGMVYAAGAVLEITACYSRKHGAVDNDINTIRAAGFAGGIVGRVDNSFYRWEPVSLSACYSTSKIVAAVNKGGIFGGGPTNVTSNCYFRYIPGNADYGVDQDESDWNNLYVFGNGSLLDDLPSGWPASDTAGQPGWALGTGPGGRYWGTLGPSSYQMYIDQYPRLGWE